MDVPGCPCRLPAWHLKAAQSERVKNSLKLCLIMMQALPTYQTLAMAAALEAVVHLDLALVTLARARPPAELLLLPNPSPLPLDR